MDPRIPWVALVSPRNHDHINASKRGAAREEAFRTVESAITRLTLGAPKACVVRHSYTRVPERRGTASVPSEALAIAIFSSKPRPAGGKKRGKR